MQTNNTLSVLLRSVQLICMLSLLQACSGGSGGGGSERDAAPDSGGASGGFIYNGPTPASAEIQSFKVNFYDNLVTDDRCGACHTSGGTGTTPFVERSDVNVAWQNARTVVNLTDPASSQVVQRVGSGHNCWLAAGSEATCAATITGYIERWAAGATATVNTVQLSPRSARDPGGAIIMPPTIADVAALPYDLTATGNLLELLNRYCSQCHSDTASIPQAPYFASDDTDIAYAAVRSKISLSNPAASRIVVRLRNEFHNCWDDCAANAQVLEDAVAEFASQLPVTTVDPSWIISRAQILDLDGIVASAGGRYEDGVVAKWEFREGSGSSVADTSGVLPEVPLTLSGEYTWLGAWGVRLGNGKAQGGATASQKLFNSLTGTGEFTIEAWVAPNNVAQMDSWIVGYGSGDQRNLLLSQSLYNYEGYTRSSTSDGMGEGAPALATADADERAQATLQHVVLTYDPINGRKLYVNGMDTGDTDPTPPGLLNTWNNAFAVVLGNSTAGDHPFAGDIRFVAVYNRAYTEAQILQNYDVGIGQKYYLLFSVSEIIDQENVCHVFDASSNRVNYCYIGFEVSEFDDASYLFNTPFFINLNPTTPSPTLNFPLEGVYLGVNGQLASAGQGFVNINTTVSNTSYGDLGQPLSPIGTIIPKQAGPDQDVFFLAFNRLAGSSFTLDDGSTQAYTSTINGDDAPDIGVRTFDEINQSYAQITGISSASPLVSATTGKTIDQTFQQVRQALPSVPEFQTMMSSHIMAATQLAAAYCDALVATEESVPSLFTGINLSANATTISDADWENQVIFPLVDRAMNTGLFASQPDRVAVKDEILLLITDTNDLKPYNFESGSGSYVSARDGYQDGLRYCKTSGCSGTPVADVVKASCVAILSSGAVLMQ